MIAITPIARRRVKGLMVCSFGLNSKLGKKGKRGKKIGLGYGTKTTTKTKTRKRMMGGLFFQYGIEV